MKVLKDKFNTLTPNRKRMMAMGGVIAVIFIFIYFGYQSRVSNKPKIVREQPVQQNVVDFTKKDEDLAMRLSFNNQMRELQDNNSLAAKNQQERIEELQKQIEAMKTGRGKDNTTNQPSDYGDLTLNGVPPSPNNYGQDVPSYNAYRQVEKEKEKPKPIVINGSIGHVNIKVMDEKKSDNATKSKLTGKRLINFIPSGSIIKGMLLNGMLAPTMGKAKSRPYPALFRVMDLAFLPNEVRKDLSGCFITGEAAGELSDSRVHIRLSKISCISNNRKRVLEKDIKGYVNGDDGKVGIYGEIKANFGKVALSALLAEFIAAAGDAIKSSTQIVTQNPLGGITTAYKPKIEDIMISAAGSGFGESAKMIAEFYLDIMKEMSPVIEISGRRSVEIIIDNGIELMVDDFDWQGVKEDEVDFSDIFSRM